MDSRAVGVAALFDRVSDTYDAVGVPWFGPIADHLVAVLAPTPGEDAVDLGCGRGAVLRRLADAVGPDGRVVGVDVARGMVERTAADLADAPHVTVLQGDASVPAVAPGSVDVVASSLVLFFLADPAAAVRTWAELLRPGGRLGVTTFGRSDEVWQEVDALFDPYLPAHLLEARTSSRRGPFATDEGVGQLLRDAGLADVRTDVRPHVAVLADVEAWQRWSGSHGQRALWDAVPAEAVPDLLRAAGQVLERRRRPDGSFALSQDVRTTTGRRPG